MGILEGKVGIVTAAASGIGQACALEYGREGAKVALSDLESQRAAAEAVVEEIRSNGGEAIFIPCDVTDENDVKHLVEQTVEVYGGLDFAHNNAGGAHGRGPMDTITLEQCEFTLRLSLVSVFLCMKYELSYMKEHGGGAILNTSSSGSLHGQDNSSVYCAAKHGVNGLTLSATSEYARYGIRCNAICPGKTETPVVVELLKKQPSWIANCPMGRAAKAEEIANAAAFLVSDKASYITGEILQVDGGSNANTISYDYLLNQKPED